MFTDISNAINKSKKILIIPHYNADGDCLGSSYALKLMLEELGKKADVILDEGDCEHRILKILDGVSCKNDAFTPDLVISVDCADKERMGTRVRAFDSCDCTINLDHHITNDKYGTYNFVNSEAAATGEIIYELAQFMNIKLTTQIVNNIYIAIVSDTGGFAYSNTKPHTHSIAAQLLQYGINNAFISSYLFEMNSKKRLELMKLAYNSLETFYNDRIAVVSITDKQMKELDASEEEAGSFVNIPRSLETSIISMSFREIAGGTVKVSIRSQLVDASLFARHYGGGGHPRAAGCTVRGNLDEVKQKLVAEAERRIKLEVRIR